MNIEGLFEKYKKIEFKPQVNLFNDIPLYAINDNKCPWCGLKLYEMRNRPLRYCKSKRCPCAIQTGKTFVCKKLSTV